MLLNPGQPVEQMIRMRMWMCRLGNELYRPAGRYHDQALDRPAQKSPLLPRVLHFNSVGSRFQDAHAKHSQKPESTSPTELFCTLVTKPADTNVYTVRKCGAKGMEISRWR